VSNNYIAPKYGKKKRIFTDDNVFNGIIILLLCIMVFMVIYPVLYTFFASISNGWAVDMGQVMFFPVGTNFNAYIRVASDPLFWRSYWNSVVITASGSAIAMFLAVTAGYAYSKKTMPGFKPLMFLMLFTMWFNAGLIPTYINLSELGLLNMFGLIIMGGTGGFTIIVMKSAYQSIPDGLLEAAYVDGANDLQAFWWVAVPSVKPTIAVFWFFAAIGRWNAWLWASIMVQEHQMPLQLYLRRYVIQRQDMVENVEALAAAAYSPTTLIYALIFTSLLPILIAFPFMQKFFKRGIFEGGIKA